MRLARTTATVVAVGSAAGADVRAEDSTGRRADRICARSRGRSLALVPPGAIDDRAFVAHGRTGAAPEGTA